MKVCCQVLVLFLSFHVLNGSSALADFVVDLTNTTTQEHRAYVYTYQMYNETQSSLPAAEFNLSLPASANLTDITGPSGWVTTYNAGDNSVDWASTSALSDLEPGQSTTFSFESDLPPGTANYLIIGVDRSSFGFDSNQGSIAGPAVGSIPEPTSMIPLGIGMITLAGYSVYRGKR